ncbi:hypothetical protein D1224_02125 [Henriciella barbarensis]|uniref:DUF3617 family protein n=1 Tax=Henriciella barbarensis TaxID=86342 RepID=A0A399R364_9PROT|nr:hypothetical protein [Henriciella barbarensis]RIJ25936.1 hypothetical protein D1224_02125 [Henriciella barbarensis]
MIRVRAALLTGAVALGAGPSALGQEDTPATEPVLAGTWVFEADLNKACTFDGPARLMPTETEGEYGCELTARQDCPAIDVTYVVEQSCRASVEEDVLTVRSEIRNFLQGEPSAFYTPDNFQLRIESESRMDGVLVGADIYPAVWQRADGAIS